MGRHSKKMEKLQIDLSEITNKAVKDSLKHAMTALALQTKQDSSNAAVHWVIVPEGKSPRSPWLTARDLREDGNAKRRKAIRHRLFKKDESGVVAYEGAKRSQDKVMVEKVAAYLREREKKEVLDVVIRGRKLAIKKFTLYNAVGEGRWGKTMSGDKDKYKKSANLDKAEKLAVRAAEDKLGEIFLARLRSYWAAKVSK